MIASIPFLIAALSASATVGPSRLAIDNCNIGEVYAFNAAECEITLSNSGDKPIRVSDVRAVNAGDRVEPGNLTIPAHANAYLKVRIDSGNGTAYAHHAIRFHTDERGYEERQADAVAFVMTVLDDARPQIDFGVVNIPGGSAQKSIALASHDVADLRITRIIQAPTWLDAHIGADGRSVSAGVKADAGWGIHADFVKLAINAPQQSQVWIEVKADVHGKVVPASNPYDMNLMRIGSDHEFRIPLRSRSGREFKVGKIELDGIRGSTQLQNCEKPDNGCRMLLLRVTEQNPGPVRGHVWIDLPEFNQRLDLAVWGLLVPKDLKIKTIDPQAMARDANAAAGQTRASRTADLGHALKAAVESATTEPPPGTGPLLKWTVANGMSIHGFQIFRSNAEAGPFVLLNPKTVPSRAETQDPIDYQYRDNTAKAGKAYWYYIGIVYGDGRKQQLSGPQEVKAK